MVHRGAERFRPLQENIKGDPHGSAYGPKTKNDNYDVVAEAEAILAEANLVTA